MASESQTLDEISRATFALLLKEPFYAHVLAGMPREVSDRTATAAVAWDGQQVRLIVNPDFFNEFLTAPQRVAVLKHEILHVVFRHLFRGKDRDQEIDNLAADLVVNQLVAPLKLPQGVVTLDAFPDLKLEPNQTVEQYYAILINLYRQMCRAGYADGQNSGGDQQGTQTGPKSETVESDSPTDDGWADSTSAPQSARAIARFLGDRSRGDHDLWTVDDGSQTMTAGRYAAGNVILRARERMLPHLGAGLPAEVLTEIKRILAERQPKVDWKRMVRIFCASSGRSRIRHTIKRISKRYGTRPGIKVQRLQRLAIVIDTSGSITQKDVEEFFVEVHAVWKTGASVVIIECDAAVHRTYEYRGKTPTSVKGGGGNDCDPAFRWIAQNGSFDGCLFITDGYVPTPTVRPNCKLLWVISEGGSTEELPFGPTVRIPASEE
jgi:predicted metal-dependent peptidase